VKFDKREISAIGMAANIVKCTHLDFRTLFNRLQLIYGTQSNTTAMTLTLTLAVNLT